MPGTDLSEERGQLVEAIDELAEILSRRGSVPAAHLARATGERLAEQRLHVVIVGAFKRGKTTLVNAMLGGEHLPAAVVPLTSVITCVSTGPDLAADVTFLDGHHERADIADLHRYVTEPGNPLNGLGVDRVLVTTPDGTLPEGVILADTPGIDSVHRHNTDVARAFLVEADAAILVTSADPPISESELGFLEEVHEQTTQLFVVMNKIDHLSPDDRARALEFTEGSIGRVLAGDARVYPVSAREALDARIERDDRALEASGLPAFEHDLQAFLAHGRSDAMLDSAAGRATRLVDDELASVTVEERGLELSAEEMTRSTDELERIFAEADRARDDLAVLLTREAARIQAAIEQDLSDMKRETTQALLARLTSFLAERTDFRSAVGEIEEQLRASLRERLDRWRAKQDHRVDALLNEATARFGEQTDSLVDRTLERSGDVLGVELPTSAATAELPAKTRFSYDFFRVPTIVESLVPDIRGYLPAPIARRKLSHDFQTKIPQLVDKHTGRLRYDYSQRIDEARRILERSLEERLRSVELILRTALERSSTARSSGEERMRRRRQELGEDRAGLVRIRDGIRRSRRDEVTR